jgi:hypothetical protein
MAQDRRNIFVTDKGAWTFNVDSYQRAYIAGFIRDLEKLEKS